MVKPARVLLIAIGFAAVSSTAQATCPTFHTLSNGSTANADLVMDNYNYILGCPYFTGNVGIGTNTGFFGLDVELAAGNTAAKFGNNKPIYLINDSPMIGFNLYYNTGWTYGKGSSSSYGSAIAVTPSTGQMDFFTTNAAGNAGGGASVTSRMTLTQAGSVGVGTAAPGAAKLYVNGDSASTSGAIMVNRSDLGGSTSHMLYGSTGDWYIRSSLTSGKIIIQDGGGNVGIGTSSPGQKLHVVGTIRQTNCTTAGTLSTNASGDIICTSDARLKNVLGDYSDGLKAITQIRPQLFTYKPTPSNPIETFVHAGFIAQNVKQVIPQAVALQHSGYYSLDTTAILAASVNAIKELKAANDQQAIEIQRLKIQMGSLERKLATKVALNR